MIAISFDLSPAVKGGTPARLGYYDNLENHAEK